MRIAAIASTFTPDISGAITSLRDRLSYFADCGDDVLAVIPCIDRTLTKCAEENYRCKIVSGCYSLSSGLNIRHTVSGLRQAIEIVERFHPDHVWLESPEKLRAIHITRLQPKHRMWKVWGFLHSDLPRTLVSKRRLLTALWLFVQRISALKECDQIVIPTSACISFIPRNLHKRVIVIPPVRTLNMDIVTSISHTPTILWVGRRTREKGWRLFLDVIRSVRKLGFKSNVIAFLPEELSHFPVCQELGISLRIGASRAEVIRAYRAGDIFVSTSMAETFGIAIWEAMSRGCIAVVPRIRSISEWTAGICFEYKTGDCQAATHAVCTALLADNRAKLSVNAICLAERLAQGSMSTLRELCQHE